MTLLRKIYCGLLAIVLSGIILSGCSMDKSVIEPDTSTSSVTITDSLGNSFELAKDSTVVSLYASYSECWLLSGGELSGVTRDAIEERDLNLSENISIVGSVKEPDLEKIIALNPDYVIMSADVTADLELEDQLKALNIAYGYFCVDTFEDYDNMMYQFCSVNNNMDSYNENVTKVKERIDEIKESVSKSSASANNTVLLMRAFSSGVKAKGDDNTAGYILKELNCNNIVDSYPSLLEDLSMEEVINQDPDYIFVLTMGDENAALSYIDDNMKNNPAWNGLSAIEKGNYYVLPKELFHYKPNNRWADSYEYLAKILYPDCF